MLSPQVWGASRQPSLHDLTVLRPSPSLACSGFRSALLGCAARTGIPQPAEAQGSREHFWLQLLTQVHWHRPAHRSSGIHDRSPTVSRCYCMNTGSKGGACELYDLKRFHPETTPVRTASITRIGHTVIPKKGGSAVGGMRLEGEETREWPAQDCLCYTSYGPFPSRFRLGHCYSGTFHGPLWPKLAPILTWFSVAPILILLLPPHLLLHGTVHAELYLKQISRYVLGTPTITLWPHRSFTMTVLPRWPSSGTGHPSTSSHGSQFWPVESTAFSFPEHGMFQKSEPSFPF